MRHDEPRPAARALAAAILVASVAVLLVAARARGQEKPAPGEKGGGGVIRERTIDGNRVEIDLGPQVLSIDAPEDVTGDFDGGRADEGRKVEPKLKARLVDLGWEIGLGDDRPAFVSAAILAEKAKRFDDGLVAAVEVAAQRGAGTFAGKEALLEALAKALPPAGETKADPAILTVLAAARAGAAPKAGAAVAPAVSAAADAHRDEVLADEKVGKPLGVYTWTPELQAIFRQDRILQQELKGAAGIAAVAGAIAADPQAAKTYEAALTLAYRLTNPPPAEYRDLRALVAPPPGRPPAAPERGLWFLPASRSPEADLVMRLYGNKPIPEGFQLVDELFARVRDGRLDLAPRADSGWYDRTIYSLEPLIAPERAAEAKRLELGERYRRTLGDLAKALLAMARETHVKQLHIPAPGAAAPPQGIVVRLVPQLAVEPLATHYRRRADGYAFVRGVLEGAFGREALAGMRRLTAQGPVAGSLDAELAGMERLFRGAEAAALRDLGDGSWKDGPGPAGVAELERFAKGLAADPDLGVDARMMVPLYYDAGRKKLKVLVVLGWTSRPIQVRFKTLPAVRAFDAGGAPLPPDRVELDVDDIHYRVAYPVTAEVFVSRLLDRGELQKLCDQARTAKEIIRRLQ